MAGMMFERNYDPQAVLRNQQSLPEERAMAETAQHLRGVIAAIPSQMNAIITPNLVEFLKTLRASESREEQVQRLEEIEEKVQRMWETSGYNYAALFRRHNIQAANQRDFAEAAEQEFMVKRDETIRAVLQERLSHSPLTQSMENRRLEEYEKVRALDKLNEEAKVARLATLLAESKGLFTETWAQSDPWKVDVERWVSYAYQMAPPAEQRQYDLITSDIPHGSLRRYVHGKLLLTIASAATSVALFMASSSATSIAGCAVLMGNMVAQIWLSNRYTNRVDAALIAPRKELQADLSLTGALLWAGVLYRSVRDLNPVWTFRKRTDATNDTQAASVTRLLCSIAQIGEILHRRSEDAVDDAVHRLQRGSRRGLSEAFYHSSAITQSLAITGALQSNSKELSDLYTRMSSKGSLSTMIGTAAGILSTLSMISILFGK